MKNEGKKLLLTIPRKDENCLLLMQLPDSLSPETLQEQNKISIVSSRPGDQACLITDNQSFSLSRVETSNALVLVPTGIEASIKASQKSQSSPQRSENPSKRAKICDEKEMESKEDYLIKTNCHLLGKGSGACFLELQEKDLNLDGLQKMLPIFDPFNCYKKFNGGISLKELTHKCQQSESQVKNGLLALQALEYHSKYSMVSEEAWQSANQAIVAALMECDEFENYCIDNSDRIVSETLKRMNDPYPQAEAVIRLVLSKLTKPNNSDTEKLSVDFKQIAVIVVHQLFAKSLTWSEDDLCQEWQAKVPGDTREISLDMLKGVAISSSDAQGTQWEYMPRDKLAKDPKERLSQLFNKREKWSKIDLVTYLEPLLGDNVGEFLASNTLTLSDNRDDDEAVPLLVRKQA